MTASVPTRGWGALFHHWGKDVQLWLYILATLQLFRLLLIGVFHGQVADDPSWSALAMVQLTGLRFDLSTASAWVLPTFLLSLTLPLYDWSTALERLRRGMAYGYALLASLVLGADLVFFDEYNDQFNQHVFGLFHDDTTAILITVWKDYHPLLFLLAAGAAIGLQLALLRRWLAHEPRWLTHLHHLPPRLLHRAGTALFIFLAVIAGVRGGTVWGEPIRLKHAFVVDDITLNRMVLNPFAALRYTVQTKLEAERAGGLAAHWPGEDLRAALAAAHAQGHVGTAQATDLDTAFARRAAGPPAGTIRPRHVFLILLESHSGWTVLPAYRWVGLSPELSALAERGLYFPHFLPAASGTIGSMNALLTGFPETGLNINYETSALQAYPTATAAIFKRLGYRTRFFYGGFLSWQRLDSLATAQGFDEVWGGGSMSRNGIDTNEWGVRDEHLFDFVLDRVDAATPSFNFILTTSNHPPYDLDLAALGYPLQALPPPLQQTKAETVRVLGHLWYTDRETGRFVRAAEQRLEAPLFAITGDHTARLAIRFPGDSVFEQVAVPFVLYGPAVLGTQAGTRPTAGAHLDIPPTLIELSAPPGFAYHALGQNLLDKAAPSHGLGYQFIVGEDFIATDNPAPAGYALPNRQRPAQLDITAVQNGYHALQALAWYRIRKGSALPPPTAATP